MICFVPTPLIIFPSYEVPILASLLFSPMKKNRGGKCESFL